MIPVIILAAGSSRRMGRPKATLPLRGSTFARTIIRNYESLRMEPIIVVVGAHMSEVIADIDACEVTAVMNERYEEGQLSSIHAGLAAIDHLNPTAVMIHPVDHPLVEISTIESLAAAAGTAGDRIVVPVSGGRRGHPVIFGAAYFDALKNAPRDVGARAVVRANSDRIVEVEVADDGIFRNIDTPEMYGAV